MKLSSRRKGDESAGAMPRVIIELLVVALVLLAAFAMFSPTFSKVFLPLTEKFGLCLSDLTEGVKCATHAVEANVG